MAGAGGLGRRAANSSATQGRGGNAGGDLDRQNASLPFRVRRGAPRVRPIRILSAEIAWNSAKDDNRQNSIILGRIKPGFLSLPGGWVSPDFP